MSQQKIVNVFSEIEEELSYLNDDAIYINRKYLEGQDLTFDELYELFKSIRLVNLSIWNAKNDLLKECKEVEE